MRTFRYIAAVGLMLVICRTAGAETPTINSRLPLQQDGPLTVSPWFLAAQPANNPDKDHYIYSTQPLLYYWGWYGYPWCFTPYYGPWYGSTHW